MTVMGELETNLNYCETVSASKLCENERTHLLQRAKEYLKKDLDKYFRIKPSEKSGTSAERLGVKIYNTIYMNTMGYLMVGPSKRVIHDYSSDSLKNNVKGTKIGELGHVACGLWFLGLMGQDFVNGDYVLAAGVGVTNLLINFYPSLLLRSTRNRLEKVLEHREKRGASK